MRTDSVKREFLRRLEGRPLEALAPPEGIHLMLNFYREERVEGCDLDADGDMLLYQRGTHDWGGGGESFELDITRQLIVVEQDHRRVKQRIYPMLSFKNLRNAAVTTSGVELAQEIRKGQFNITQLKGGMKVRIPQVWELVLAD